MKYLLSLVMVIIIGAFSSLPAHPITVDGDDSDWVGTPSGTDSFVYSGDEAIWNDAAEDDTGDGGNAPGASDNPAPYTYPTNAQFLGTEADLNEFRITLDDTPGATKLSLLIRIAFDQTWLPIGGILMDFDQTPGSGQTDCGGYSDALVDSDIAWEYAVYVRNEAVQVKDSNIDDVDGYHENYYSTDNDLIEISIDTENFTTKPTANRYRCVVFAGLQDYDNMRDVDYTASEWKGGGGLDEYFNPKIYDLGFVEAESQPLDLNNYTDTQKTVIRSSSAQLIDLRTSVESTSWGGIKAEYR